MKTVLASLLAISLASLSHACSLCGDPVNRTTLREEIANAQLILVGRLTNPQIGDDRSAGSVQFQIETILRDHPALRNRRSLTINRYVPLDEGAVNRYVVFCTVTGESITPGNSKPVRSPALIAYIREWLAQPKADSNSRLSIAAKHLGSADAEVALDAFAEFGKASDAEVAVFAPGMDPRQLRDLLSDPKTPPERRGLLAFLLGSCGTSADVAFLSKLARDTMKETRVSLSGILCGLVRMEPGTGWSMVRQILADPKRPFSERLAALGVLRFYHAWQPVETRAVVSECLGLLLKSADLADLATEDLRRWGWWEHTEEILSLYGKAGYDSPMMRRAFLRYALKCPEPAAARFIAEREQVEAELVKDVREALKFE